MGRIPVTARTSYAITTVQTPAKGIRRPFVNPSHQPSHTLTFRRRWKYERAFGQTVCFVPKIACARRLNQNKFCNYRTFGAASFVLLTVLIAAHVRTETLKEHNHGLMVSSYRRTGKFCNNYFKKPDHIIKECRKSKIVLVRQKK